MLFSCAEGVQNIQVMMDSSGNVVTLVSYGQVFSLYQYAGVS